MTKLYRYRPLSDFLFKELYYQELYFASYDELNDPLDLTAKIDFRVSSEGEVQYLLWYILKFSATRLISESPSNDNKLAIQKLAEFNKNEDEFKRVSKLIFIELSKLQNAREFVSFSLVENVIDQVIKDEKLDLPLAVSEFNNEIKRLTKVFLENSLVVCFSETNDNYLMWPHYSSKHTGICLEFSLQHEGLFPYEIQFPRKSNIPEYEKRISTFDTKSSTFWEKIHKVEYQKDLPFINFFKFANVFENEDDCDLMGLRQDGMAMLGSYNSTFLQPSH